MALWGKQDVYTAAPKYAAVSAKNFDTVATTQTGTLTAGSTAVTLSGSNAAIAVGQAVIANGSIVNNPTTYVASISGTTLTLSQAALVSGGGISLDFAVSAIYFEDLGEVTQSPTPAYSTTAAATLATVGVVMNSITLAAPNTSIAIGQTITGSGVDFATTVTANTAGVLTLSKATLVPGNAVTLTCAITQNATGTNVAGLIPMTTTTGIAVGQVVSGAGIPPGTTVASLVASTSVTVTPALTSGVVVNTNPITFTTSSIGTWLNNVITTASTTGIAVGQVVRGSVAGVIDSATTVASFVASTSVTLSKAVLAPNASFTLTAYPALTTAVSAGTTNTLTITTNADIKVGMAVTGPNIDSNTIVQTYAGGTSLILNKNVLGAVAGTLSFFYTTSSGSTRGLKAPGWTKFTSYIDSGGNVRNKSEILVSMKVPGALAGDSQNDDNIITDAASSRISLTTNPSDRTAIGAGATTFPVVGTTDVTGATLSYQWQYKASNVAGYNPWRNLINTQVVNGATHSTVTTATLNVTGTTTFGAQYRCVVTAVTGIEATPSARIISGIGRLLS